MVGVPPLSPGQSHVTVSPYVGFLTGDGVGIVLFAQKVIGHAAFHLSVVMPEAAHAPSCGAPNVHCGVHV